jgi:hypothetical protein
LKRVSYTNLSTVQPVNKQAILRKLGQLTDDEMAEVSERLIRALEIDVSGYVAQLSPSREESSPSEPERPS